MIIKIVKRISRTIIVLFLLWALAGLYLLIWESTLLNDYYPKILWSLVLSSFIAMSILAYIDSAK